MLNVKKEKKDDKGNVITSENFTIEIDGKDCPVQVKNFMSTDEYFQMYAISGKTEGETARLQTLYFLETMIINPKVDKKTLGSLPIQEILLLSKLIREMTMPDEIFLELGLLPEGSQQPPK